MRLKEPTVWYQHAISTSTEKSLQQPITRSIYQVQSRGAFLQYISIFNSIFVSNCDINLLRKHSIIDCIHQTLHKIDSLFSLFCMVIPLHFQMFVL